MSGRSPPGTPALTPHAFELSIAGRRSLDALCRTIVPSAYDGDLGADFDLAAAVERRLTSMDGGIAVRVARLLVAFDSPAAGVITRGSARRFSSLAPASRRDVLAAWEISRIPLRRTVFQALRRLILTTHYAAPEALATLGVREPLAERVSMLDWEGPLRGTPTDADPIARSGYRTSIGPAGRARASTGEARVVRQPESTHEGDRELPAGVTPGASLEPDVVLRTGVLVIGSGAGGAVAAARLAELGHELLIVEEGSWWNPREFTEREAEMMPRLYADGGARTTEDLSVTLLQGRAAGGSALVNWLVMLRTPDWVLDEWRAEHGAEDMDAAAMAPVFELIERETHTRSVPDDAHSPANRALLDGARALGWHVRAASINTEGCVRAGTCGLGCRYDAKRGAASVYLPRALRAGARLITETRVERMEIAERGGSAPVKRVHSVVTDRTTGMVRGRLTIEAPIVVLAAGAVGTPAFLQRSVLGGPAAGRFLRLHPTTAVVGVYEQEMYAAAGIPLSAVCDEHLRGTDGYGFWLECAPLYPAFASAALPGFGDAHAERMREFPRLGPIISLVRDGADRRVSSGDVRVDRQGRARIRYQLSAVDRRAVAKGVQAAARVHLAAGATEAYTLHASGGRVRTEAEIEDLSSLPYGPNRIALFSAHVNGTARIGMSARLGCCTPDGAVRGAPGVYIADGSLLPTAPGVNPQETIMAVATVLARKIHARHSSQ